MPRKRKQLTPPDEVPPQIERAMEGLVPMPERLDPRKPTLSAMKGAGLLRPASSLPSPPPNSPSANPVLVAADQFNEGTGAPKQAVDFSIHLSRGLHDGAYLCGQVRARNATGTVVPADHPALCRQCQKKWVEQRNPGVPVPHPIYEKLL
jgi:hypothetical protein